MIAGSILVLAVSAAVIDLKWSVGWTTGNPDGLLVRRVIGVNGYWPIPAVYANLGDTINLSVQNNLDIALSVHAHGIFHPKSPFYDGTSGVSECGIAPGSSYNYTYDANQSGTYWFHGHSEASYVDGLRAPLVIRDPILTPLNDGEYTLSVSDWYHTLHAPLVLQYLNISNPQGNEPIPDSAIINDGLDPNIYFQPGKKYLIHVISTAAFAGINFYIDGHDMQIVEVDGVYVKPYTVKVIPIGSAQRYSVLVTANPFSYLSTYNYLIHADIDQAMLPSPCARPNATIPIWYGYYAPFYKSRGFLTDPNQFDQSKLVPVIPIIASNKSDIMVVFNTTFEVYNDGINHGTPTT